MITSILATMASNVLVGWLVRRLGELLSFLLTIVPVFLSLPPAYQDAFLEILAGRGGGLSIATYFGMASYLFTQWRSWKATNDNHVVIGGQKVPILTEEEAKDDVERRTGVRPSSIPSR